MGVQVLWRTSLESSSFAIDFLGGAAFLAAGFLGAFWKSSSLALGLALLPPPPLLLLLGAVLVLLAWSELREQREKVFVEGRKGATVRVAARRGLSPEREVFVRHAAADGRRRREAAGGKRCWWRTR